VQFHQPGLVIDDYTITVTQTVTLPRNQTATFSTQKHFSVSGERFAFNPQDIQAVFPPAGSLGEHSNVLPHVVFTRSTLPWELQADPAREDVPWLALLLFEDQEKPTPQIVTLNTLTNPDGGARFPALQLNTGQKADDQATVIDIKKSGLQTMLPTLETLALLTHVRVRLHADGTRDEMAVIIGSRLPVRGGSSTVHLVSLEGRYSNGSFDYQGAGDFDGEIDSVAVHQKPEMLHSGLDKDEQIPPTYHKILRDDQGNEQEALTLASIPWLQEAQRIIDISGLAHVIQQKTGATMFTAAQFAFQMAEGVEEVIFHKG